MQQAEVRWIILADSAEVISNKLYAMGAGWETLTVNSGFPLTYPFSVAVEIAFKREGDEMPLVPVQITVHHEDDEESLASIEAEFLPVANHHRYSNEMTKIIIAFRLLMTIPREGRYWVTARFGAAELRRPFAVLAGPNVEEILEPPKVKRNRRAKPD
jgi:hypothetical protein